ncbi:DUF6203 family protein [Actinomadura sp. ATCC 31491]|uniref:DUF6203 family protein n=1 Tax=Actinomadura luzonensis TaxID=2805427 RepID=A0ABT0FW06_9ACTN|nr:DUF6203 family protein [Actinomadura luzonensis]MCK2216505.1 DUF6203 family protein [Actinomadura luzonensis]
MKRLLKVLVARRLAATPLGLAFLAAGWLLGRRRRRRAQPPTPAPARRTPTARRTTHH